MSGCAVLGMTHFCTGFTVSEASKYLSDAGGGEVNFLHVSSAPSIFVRDLLGLVAE